MGENLMAMTVMNKHTGETATLLHSHDGYLFLSREDGSRPWSSPADNWEEPSPKMGDVWVGQRSTSDIPNTEYRVIGVDEERKMYFIVVKGDFYDGAWPRMSFPGQVQMDADFDGQAVFVRSYPDSYLKLESRLG